MPRIENLSSFSFKYACESSSYGTLYVGYITNSTFYNFTDVTTSTTTTLTTINLTTADINTLNSTNGACLAFYWYCDSNWAVGIDDITYTTQAFTYGEWVNKTNVTSPLDITNLTPSTTYEWQVQGVNCDGNNNATDWSEYVFFTTTNQYVKHIVGYSNYENNKGGWYLIASPIGTVLPTAVTNMIANPVTDYDLFTFDQNETDEWRNYKQGRFTELEPGKGYLYANKENVDLIFTIGAGTAYDDDGEVNLVYSESNTIDPFMRGWNLVGNPYGQTAWINNRPYYTLNDVGDEYVPINADDASIEPMEGIFVVATGTGQSVTFSTTPPSKRGSSLTINVNEDGKFVDRAIVDFNQNGTLPKFQFDRNHTKVYIPQDGQDYAIVCSKAIGALPVNFKAENNGTYSLSFSSKNAEFAYLHLVDNMTGADIDLLQTPSYSFEAKTTDYESRFKLVFATGDNSKEENFAFFINGSFVINNEGEATLQVIDIMGRIIKSESINGCTNVNVNAAPGVYMLRLVNGDNVKAQKVVVR